jgi:HSP20 family protein
VSKAANDLVARNFWNFPGFRLPTIWEEDDDFLTTPTFSNGISISEDEKNVYVETELPGLKPEEVEVTFHKGVLWVKGEAKEEDKNKKYYRRSQRSFSYRVAVPGELDQNAEPNAEYKNGVMTVCFAKSPKAEPKKIEVKTA